MLLTNDKDLRRIIKDAKNRGWIFTKKERHIKGKHPNGQTVTIGNTPSDYRAYKNIKSNLKLR